MKLWPARQKSKHDMIADLDALVVEPVYFTLLKREHKIKPITTEEFLKFVNSYSRIVELSDRKEITTDEFIDAYYGVISSVCDTISRKDVSNMTTAQVGALFQLIISSVTGEAQGNEKKTLQKMMTLSKKAEELKSTVQS